MASKNSRKTKRLDEILIRIALSGSAKESLKICKAQKISISPDTLLCIAKAWGKEIDVEDITAAQADDFALKKHRY